MTPYEFATWINGDAGRDHKISVTQADYILLRLETDPALASALGRHLYGTPPPPQVYVEAPQPEVIENKAHG